MPIVSTGAPMMPSPHVQRANDAALSWQQGSISPLVIATAPLASRPSARHIERVQLGRSPAHV